jgi:thioredoxin-like negative regulator of GroEL
MSISSLIAAPATDAAVLLVLLPGADDQNQPSGSVQTLVNYLQDRLHLTIRVLKIDATTHPAVVQSFQPRQLPAFVLVRQGVELWRQQGQAEGEATAMLVLSKLGEKMTE